MVGFWPNFTKPTEKGKIFFERYNVLAKKQFWGRHISSHFEGGGGATNKIYLMKSINIPLMCLFWKKYPKFKKIPDAFLQK
jgi:hypothetical protein